MRARTLGSTSDSGAWRSVMAFGLLAIGYWLLGNDSFVDLLDPTLMTPTLKGRLQPLMQNTHALFLTDELRWQNYQIRVPVLARQFRYLLIPCQRRPYSGEAVCCIRHAQSCTTSEHSALHFPAAHRLRHRLRVVGVIVRRIQLLRPDINRLIPELLQLIDEPILQIEPDMIGSNIDLLSHGSYPIAHSP